MEENIEEAIAEQRRELMEAAGFEDDLDFAFQLQMQEALVASLALQPSSSSAPPPILEALKLSTTPSIAALQTLELDKFQQERKDREQCELEMLRVTEDLNRRIHDQNFAREIVRIPEEDWVEFGDEVERPFGEGSSSSVNQEEPFRLYFKGLLDEKVSAIGVAVCDERDNLVLKIQKCLGGGLKNHREVELRALIEGLNAAVGLKIKRINLYCVNRTVFQHISGRWTAKQRSIATLVNQVFLLQRKFEICRPFLVPGSDLKYAFKLARDAIDSLVPKPVESNNTKTFSETCNICLEDTDTTEMLVVNGCLHRYCSACMKQHMEVKILQGVLPGCPHEGCKTTLSLDGSKKVLTPKLIETMSQLIKEASVPVTEKVYCPYPKCSTLMSKTEALEYANKFMAADRSAVRKCVNCHGLFCIDCKVPWHSTMSCHEFKRSNLSSRGEEAKLKSLANQNLWRQCVKCSHMIELAEGCYHMTCRCGYEFCYTCGAEWKNKKPTCRCKLWDERNILHDYDEDEDDDDDFDDEDDYDEDDEEEFVAYPRGWHFAL